MAILPPSSGFTFPPQHSATGRTQPDKDGTVREIQNRADCDTKFDMPQESRRTAARDMRHRARSRPRREGFAAAVRSRTAEPDDRDGERSREGCRNRNAPGGRQGSGSGSARRTGIGPETTMGTATGSDQRDGRKRTMKPRQRARNTIPEERGKSPKSRNFGTPQTFLSSTNQRQGGSAAVVSRSSTSFPFAGYQRAVSRNPIPCSDSALFLACSRRLASRESWNPPAPDRVPVPAGRSRQPMR